MLPRKDSKSVLCYLEKIACLMLPRKDSKMLPRKDSKAVLCYLEKIAKAVLCYLEKIAKPSCVT